MARAARVARPVLRVDLGAGDERRIDPARDARVEVDAVRAGAVRAAARAAGIEHVRALHGISGALEAALESSRRRSVRIEEQPRLLTDEAARRDRERRGRDRLR